MISAPAGDASTRASDRQHRAPANCAISRSRRGSILTSRNTRTSKKFAVASMIPPGGGMMSAKFSYVGRKDHPVDYFDGEE